MLRVLGSGALGLRFSSSFKHAVAGSVIGPQKST